MISLREFILEQSSLPTGATIRQHLNNQKICTGHTGRAGGTPWYVVDYVGEVSELLTLPKPSSIVVAYPAPKVAVVEYIRKPKQLVSYIMEKELTLSVL